MYIYMHIKCELFLVFIISSIPAAKSVYKLTSKKPAPASILLYEL